MTVVSVTKNNYFDIIRLLHDKVFSLSRVQISMIDENDEQFDKEIKTTMKKLEKNGTLDKMMALTRKYEKQGKL